jgi:hypothetical protein
MDLSWDSHWIAAVNSARLANDEQQIIELQWHLAGWT